MNLTLEQRKALLNALQVRAAAASEEELLQMEFVPESEDSTPSSSEMSTISSIRSEKTSDAQFFNIQTNSGHQASFNAFYIDSSKQMHWIRSPSSFYLSRKPNDESALEIFSAIMRELLNLHVELFTDPADSQKFGIPVFKNGHVDLAIVIGGDGSLLRASAAFPLHPPPVALINAGSLGFLAVLKSGGDIIEKLLNGPLYLSKRRRLMTSFKQKNYLALNEIYIHRGYSAFLTNLLVFLNEKFIGRIEADGLLLSSPTGSTAYALSAGGVPVSPAVECMMLTPVCPHVMSSKQLILDIKSKIKIKNDPNARSCATISVDGRHNFELKPGESIRIWAQDDEDSLYTICRADENVDFFRGLKNCLNWNVRIQEKGFGTGEKVTYEVGDADDSEW